jgi:Uma2 family endonuclease
MVAPARRMSLAEFLKIPERKPALEYEFGEITQKVSPKARHSALQVALCMLINGLLKARRRGYAFSELRTTFAGQSLVPDVAVFRWERIPLDENGEVVQDITIPPDIAVEIPSPRQSGPRQMRRCLWYVANGVKAALLVDEKDRTVFVYRPDAIPQAARGADQIDLTDVVPELRLTAEEIFGALRFA